MIDVRTAYLQGDEIERVVHFKPPEGAKTEKLWKLRKTVYGLMDAAQAWYRSVVGYFLELGGIRNSLDPTIFLWKNGKRLKRIMCSHVDDIFFYGGGKDFEVDVVRS